MHGGRNGEIAQSYPVLEGTKEDDFGKKVPVHAKAIEVLWRRSDGSWKLIMGDPNEREGNSCSDFTRRLDHNDRRANDF